MFDGATHPLLVKPCPIDPSVTARFVRINPVQWYQKPCLRMELYRCSLRNGNVLLQLFTEEKIDFVSLSFFALVV